MDMLKKESKKRVREEKMDPNSTVSGDGQATAAIEHRSFARIGFLGNPSDVYFGRTISLTIGNFWASVKLEPSEHLVIKPHPFHDLVQFTSLDHLVRSLSISSHSPLWISIYPPTLLLFSSLCLDAFSILILWFHWISGSSFFIRFQIICLLVWIV